METVSNEGSSEAAEFRTPAKEVVLYLDTGSDYDQTDRPQLPNFRQFDLEDSDFPLDLNDRFSVD